MGEAVDDRGYDSRKIGARQEREDVNCDNERVCVGFDRDVANVGVDEIEAGIVQFSGER